MVLCGDLKTFNKKLKIFLHNSVYKGGVSLTTKKSVPNDILLSLQHHVITNGFANWFGCLPTLIFDVIMYLCNSESEKICISVIFSPQNVHR